MSKRSYEPDGSAGASPAQNLNAALVAVDVGNTKIHVGVFEPSHDALPRPRETLQLASRAESLERLGEWVSAHTSDCRQWALTSVNAPTADRLWTYLSQRLPRVMLTALTYVDAPLAIEVDHPERVGIDRLMAAVGANALRARHRPAIVICAGTAITVNFVAANGAFQGGAILPGMAMASQILDRYTDKLPWIDTDFLHGPPPVGKNTEAALASGIYWGTVGALAALIEKMSPIAAELPEIFLTGGDASRLVSQLPAARHVPDLVLSGIALTWRAAGRDAAGEGE